MRKCCYCGETRPLEDFAPKRKSDPSKRHYACRACNVIKRREWAAKNAEKVREYRQRYRESGKAKAAEKAWRAANPDKVREHKRRDSEKNAERYRRVVTEWRKANPERVKENIAAAKAKKPELYAEIRRRTDAARRARKAAAFVEHVDSLVVLESYDGACGICGQDVDPLSFEVDHIIPIAKGGEHSYANTQPAHMRCNRAKSARLDYAA